MNRFQPPRLYWLFLAVVLLTAAEGGAPGQQLVIVRGKGGKNLYLFSGGRALKKM